MDMRTTVSAEEVAKFGAIAKLWALIDVLAENSRSIPTQFHSIWLVWAYDAEVKNGGHLQYFHNRGVESVPATLNALKAIGAGAHAQLLEGSWSAVKLAPVARVKSLGQYSQMAEERSFAAEDSAYYALPDVTDLLAQHNEEVLNELVKVRV